MQSEQFKFCVEILPAVSRTFAINIRILKGDLHKSVLCAYLFCRIVDTAEDSEHLSHQQRASLLNSYMTMFATSSFETAKIREWVANWGTLDTTVPEYRLIANLQTVIEVFAQLPPQVQRIVQSCVVEMSDGMRATVTRKHLLGEKLFTLADMADLENYCHYVAGTVGKMLTDLFIYYQPDFPDDKSERLRTLGPAFALGLQMTNIIKDCHSDYLRGWCYLPADLMNSHGVAPTEFFAPAFRRPAQSTLNDLILKAAGCLDDAFEYTLTIPPSQPRLRLFNLWSLFFAIRTLRLAWDNPALLNGKVRVKISRFEVYSIMVQTVLCVRSDALLRRLYRSSSKSIPR